MNIAEFKRLPILGILRGIEAETLEPLLTTITAAGLKTIEITMNTKDAARLIREAVALANKRMVIGAGTVLSMKDLDSALGAGATFIVMPVLIKDVTAYCVRNHIPVFPGAFSPQEINTAWDNGATMVKVFPSNFLGPEYFKEIKGPFKDIELLACGGITPENMKVYFANGASAVSFGASVFRKEWFTKKDFKAIGRVIKKYIKEFTSLKNIGIKNH